MREGGGGWHTFVFFEGWWARGTRCRRAVLDRRWRALVSGAQLPEEEQEEGCWRRALCNAVRGKGIVDVGRGRLIGGGGSVSASLLLGANGGQNNARW